MKTIIHYLKTRALKQITQWLVIAAFSIMILGAFAVADAYAASKGPIIPHFPPLPNLAATCVDLEGGTAGTCDADQGCMDFDLQNGDDNAPWAAELCSPNVIYVDDELQDFELHGWVWNTNLGYMSLYCDSSGKNNGVDCGSIPYGVKIDSSTGEMYGWAWSDNLGWISFGCQDGLNEGYACGNIDYSTSINLDIGEDLGKISGYAWSDSIGWFDFELGDVHTKLLEILMRTSSSETPWGVWTKSEISGSLSDSEKDNIPLKSTMPVAGSGEGYDLFVYVADIAGNPIQSSADVTVDIETQWKDTVGYNQTDNIREDSSDANGGIVVKPSVKHNAGKVLTFDSGPTTTGGIDHAYYGRVTSSMPTDGGNCYDGDGDGSCYTGDDNYLYKDFAGEGAPENEIIYYSATVTVTVPSTGETWTRTITPLGYPSGRKMEFLPQIDIPTFDYLMIPGDLTSSLPFIQAIRNKVDEFNIDGQVNVTPSKGYSVTLVLESTDADINYVFIDGPTDESDPSTKSNTLGVENVNDLDGSVYALPYSPNEDALTEFVEGASIKSVVSISHGLMAMPNSYFSNGLPRGRESAVQTQAAQIVSGSVFSPGAKDVVQGSDVPLFGDTAVYELRTAILEDVSNLIRGFSVQGIGSEVTINSSTNLNQNKLKDGRLYYFEDQDVIIDDISVLANGAPGKGVTLIVKGGDLYINDNIDESQPFGFIVFESDDDNNQATKGGRLYVNADVTDMVDVHIFSDGPMFRYDDAVCYYWGNYGPGNALVGLREPNFVDSSRCSSPGSFKEPTAALPNQFYLKGNVASFNCLGCSTDIKPSRGDGLDLGGSSALNFAIARLYDFNYFSYFRIHPVTGADSGARSSNVTANPAITDKDKAVYFEYSPAPTDLLGFRNF